MRWRMARWHNGAYATGKSVADKWTFASPEVRCPFGPGNLLSLLREGGFARDDIAVHHVNAGMGVKGLIAIARKQ
ncbi:MAG: hypothetical protein KGR48_02180 [Alphaproteobacteria bacterium]|nr:hypothetical protein [Alphaproteobacteria bacterium]MBU6472505.1 hypothetical protein [Alphaproteobacteria bacterium]MDE2011477.1 hypothetical protein [Alphaproteobacteria bacterium]MDE2071868.1 hypothetical protein [Alphaproteobacteria bacterium]MDE2351597.1 hypothetical protein [Alphaproteobacteria bacterium]